MLKQHFNFFCMFYVDLFDNYLSAVNFRKKVLKLYNSFSSYTYVSLIIFHYFDFCYFLKLEFSSFKTSLMYMRTYKVTDQNNQLLIKHLPTWMSEMNSKLTNIFGFVMLLIKLCSLIHSDVEAKIQKVEPILAISLSFRA